MSSRVSRRRRREDEDEDEDDSGTEGHRSPSGNDGAKRRRLESDLEDDEQPRRRIAPAGEDGFQPGAIVRVNVQNFVTYEKAEFLPGPNLNMVIGPNGTGKSSLVCAICLGLGYSPKHLGRAGTVKEFVKHGKDTATIEIELQKRPQDRSNFVVRVQIRREQNIQKWFLNGKETTHKKIQSLMHTLKIQVDNLCQFLPQDRVVEFAASTPVELLHETLRAAAPEAMQVWHRQLQGLHRDKKEVAEAARSDAETLKNLQGRQQGLQADVDRIREREEIQERVSNLQGALVIAQYQEARNNHLAAKDRRKEAENKLKHLEQESGPSLQAVNRKQVYAQEIKAAIPSRAKAFQDALLAAQDLAQEISSAADDVKEWSNKIGAERKGFDEKKKEVAASKNRLTALQAELRNRPPDFNAGEWNQKIRAEEHNLRDVEDDQRRLGSELDESKKKGAAKMDELRKLRADINSLNTQEGQQLSFMRKHFPELATAWDWVQEHQDEFEREVFGPPMLCCSVKDERYSDQVQAVLQNDDLLCFTTQTKNDYRRLSNQLYREMSLSAVIRTCLQPLAAFGSPVNTDEAQSLGLDGFALSYLDGPEPVLAMLCAEKRLHQSGVSLRDHSDDEYEKIVRHGKIHQWVAGKQQYLVRRRKEYGPNAMTTATKRIQPGRFWTSQPVDSHEKNELNRLWTLANEEKDEMATAIKDIKRRKEELKEKQTRIQDQIANLRTEKNALQKELTRWQSIPQKIGQYRNEQVDCNATVRAANPSSESEERNREASEQAMREARERIVELGFEWDKAAVERAKLVLRHQEALGRLGKAHNDLTEAKMRCIEAKSDIEGLKARNSSIMEKLEQEKLAVQQAAEEATQARESGRRLSDKVREVISENPEKRDVYSSLAENRTAAEIEMDISAEQANLELIHAANPNVIREFERRGQEIAKLVKKMDAANGKLAALTEQLDELMGKWEPRLDALVSKINDAFAYNFEQISCAGEVRVHKSEDFDQWALDIMVKFRENETLQKLNAHRQSGGERAVSTIFFLMALQSMAQSPFRVVDEINQGMDPRNERMVHERMVEIACREHTSQYFLITPKLLTGLRYDPKMRVLCIASGEHMPKDGTKLDLGRCLTIQKRLMAASA
ncbi:structural maintenance of chromosomes 5 [Trichoderma cornu-damae]|uniref:Structural maintenance of chromosomes protein 5 n=1 Tax=Trichoderma cornu-damae TaxID=654480 RepID=A0A9P8QLZ1_9HYPO|nr:structural maintenance of chromosomes 5 [Trichoderma cornu-damae]